MVFWSVSMTAQSHNLPQPQMSAEETCCSPPPGLVVPIDEHSYILVFAGIGMGIYFLRLRKTA